MYNICITLCIECSDLAITFGDSSWIYFSFSFFSFFFVVVVFFCFVLSKHNVVIPQLPKPSCGSSYKGS